jgi:hypothetical protein
MDPSFIFDLRLRFRLSYLIIIIITNKIKFLSVYDKIADFSIAKMQIFHQRLKWLIFPPMGGKCKFLSVYDKMADFASQNADFYRVSRSISPSGISNFI